MAGVPDGAAAANGAAATATAMVASMQNMVGVAELTQSQAEVSRQDTVIAELRAQLEASERAKAEAKAA